MARNPSGTDSCPCCWASKHKCKRDPVTGVCRSCKVEVTRILSGGVVPYAADFYDAAAHAELFKDIELRSLPSLDINVGSQDFNIFGIQIKTCDGQTSNLYTFKIDGSFSTQNKDFMHKLDKMVEECLTVSLRDRDQFCHAIRRVTLAGGYAHLLCSTIRATEEVQTIRDGSNVENEFASHNLHIHFQYILVCRLSALLKESLQAIRFEDPAGEFAIYTTDAFASAAVLCYEMSYFIRNLRNGELSRVNPMPDGFKKVIIRWFSSVERELKQHLRLGCGQYLNWQKIIHGSKKRSRRRTQKLLLAFTLKQTKHTVGEPPPTPSIYTASGNGNIYLLPPESPTMLAVPGLFYDEFPREIAQIPSHVSSKRPLFRESATYFQTYDTIYV